ncbi:MAG: hypothetical protein WAK29_01200 [Terriglobales bacterium]
MPRMLDLIRNSEVPASLMQSAARGALSVPPAETIEILVYLALHHKLFGDEARLTLAGWDEKASMAVAADSMTSGEVLGYFVDAENLRISLLPTLAENPSVSEESLGTLAMSGSRAVMEALWASARVMGSPRLLQALQANANVRPSELVQIEEKLAVLGDSRTSAEAEAGPFDEAIEGAVAKYLEENAAELVVEADKPFQPIGALHENAESEASVVQTSAAGAGAAARPVAVAAAQAKKHPIPAHVPAHEERRDSTLQKISKLNIQGRIALAMRGSKEERSILIRDSTKLVALAVLDSPKVSDGEVEKFALQKNVLESVLRTIPMKRKFAKNYSIMRNLVFNPRTPLDVSLGLMKTLLVHDLKNLSGNKEVSDTIRKLALRMFKQKLEKKG